MEKERGEAKEEAKLARLVAVAAGDAKAQVEDNLDKVQGALEVRQKVEVEVACLEVERTSLMLEIGATKNEVSSLHSQTGKDKASMEEDYQKPLELIFAYGYKCCMFKHNICGDQPEVPNGMSNSSDPLSLEFFVNPKCPLILAAIEATTTEADQSEVVRGAEELEKSSLAGDFVGTS